MNPTFTIDEDGITIMLNLESRFEKAVAKMLKDYDVLAVNLVNEERAYYVADPEIRAVKFRMTRKESA
jgi:hypothetical protein